MSDESLAKQQRYVSSCYAYQPVNNGRQIVYIAYRSISSMIIHYSTYFTSIGHIYLAKTRRTSTTSEGTRWYRLAHVCQRWRNLTLGSASYLRLSLACTNGTPVKNTLEHSPLLPLTVFYRSEDSVTTEDEEGIFLALEQCHRIRHLCLKAGLMEIPHGLCKQIPTVFTFSPPPPHLNFDSF